MRKNGFVRQVCHFGEKKSQSRQRFYCPETRRERSEERPYFLVAILRDPRLYVSDGDSTAATKLWDMIIVVEWVGISDCHYRVPSGIPDMDTRAFGPCLLKISFDWTWTV